MTATKCDERATCAIHMSPCDGSCEHDPATHRNACWADDYQQGEGAKVDRAYPVGRTILTVRPLLWEME